MRRTSLFVALATVMAIAFKKPEPFSAQVFGSGFQEGVTVSIGNFAIPSIERYDSNTLEIRVPPLQAEVYDLTVKNPDGTSHTLKSALAVRNRPKPQPVDPTAGLPCNNITINFAFDSSSLSESSREILSKNLLCFTTGAGTVRIEGHADERGTTAYNLALAQRRADTVQRWMSAQGVPASRLRTVSMGEERPVDPGHTEAAWARNRRSEISAPRQ